VKLERSIDINAAPEVVWDVTLDVEHWPEWTASMKSIKPLSSGPIKLGSRYHVTPAGVPSGPWTVTEFEDRGLFTWITRTRGVDVVARHRIQPIAGGTRVTLELEYSGFPLKLFGWQIRRLSNRSLELEANGMKARAEAKAK
jgi:hypothetical protein